MEHQPTGRRTEVEIVPQSIPLRYESGGAGSGKPADPFIANEPNLHRLFLCCYIAAELIRDIE
jgi:hypothetical protein